MDIVFILNELSICRQCRAAQQVGMKEQSPTLHLEEGVAVIVGTHNLSRSKKHKCPLLIIIFLPAIFQFATVGIFQYDAVETHILPPMWDRWHFRKV